MAAPSYSDIYQAHTLVNSTVPYTEKVDTADVTLSVDFSWKQWGARVSNNTSRDKAIYNVDYKNPISPTMTFRKCEDNSIIGAGKIHAVNINADYELHGIKGKIKALKRLETSYTHLSYNYSRNPDVPMAMTWTGKTTLKNWTFTCLDENQLPVARFTANSFAVHKMAELEFIGPKAHERACQEEVLVVGITLYYCMTLRASNIFNLFGSLIASPGKLDKEASMRERARVTGELNPNLGNSSNTKGTQ